MKTTVKVTMTNTYSGRSISFRVSRSKWETSQSNGKWEWMTDGQRKKAEKFFGKFNAYYTKLEFEDGKQ